MNTLHLELDGDPETILLHAFGSAIQNWLAILADLDAGVSGNPRGTVDWIISDLAIGSACVKVIGRNRTEGQDFAPRVVREHVAGIRLIESEGVTPPYQTERGIKGIRNMFRLITREGVTGLRIWSPEEEAVVSAKGVVHAGQLLSSRYTSIGSIEGRLETISLHRGSKVVVYHQVTHRGVSCRLPRGDEWLERVKDALGKRVNVAGLIHWNARGEQVRVDVEDLRLLRPRSELPSSRDIGGKFPRLIGKRTTEAYLKEVRGG